MLDCVLAVFVHSKYTSVGMVGRYNWEVLDGIELKTTPGLCLIILYLRQSLRVDWFEILIQPAEQCDVAEAFNIIMKVKFIKLTIYTCIYQYMSLSIIII